MSVEPLKLCDVVWYQDCWERGQWRGAVGLGEDEGRAGGKLGERNQEGAFDGDARVLRGKGVKGDFLFLNYLVPLQ